MKDQQALRVVQVSDSHLFASTEGKLLGLNTQFSLDKVLDLVRAEQGEHMDILLATGDLSQDGSEEAYTRLKKQLDTFQVPTYWLEGNHDVTKPMLAALQGADKLSPCQFSAGNWHFILLDSTIPGEVPGKFFDDDIAFLEQALATSTDKHVMVCLHHHPMPMGCQWLDTQVVANADRFFDVIDRYSSIRAVVWGHVHQEFAGERNGVKLFSVPSTCVQFTPNSEDFSVDTRAPGYRWFDLYPDGRIDSGVSRVEGVEFEVDFSIKGY